MKTFLNVVGALAIIGSALIFLAAKSAVHEIEACIALLLGCTSVGFAKVIESQEKNSTQLALLIKGLAESVQAIQATATHAPSISDGTIPVPGKEDYFVSDGERAVGPYKMEKIKALAAKGTINQDTYILKQGSKEWQKLGAVVRPQPFKLD